MLTDKNMMLWINWWRSQKSKHTGDKQFYKWDWTRYGGCKECDKIWI